MSGTKALALCDWARAEGLPMLRFDYSGHGLSEGSMLHASIGDWLEETLAIIGLIGERRTIVVGSSMGGWISLLLARHLARHGASKRLAGLALIAPAFDMTERLIWHRLAPEMRETLLHEGVYYAPSLYGDPYPLTRHLIEEGRSHLIGNGTFDPGAPVRIIQGMCDPDVPWGHALDLLDLLCSRDIELTLIKDGDHRLSRPEDLRRLQATVAELVAKAAA
jgi:pimeloyl-ACP methyl ester carboxylesterase